VAKAIAAKVSIKMFIHKSWSVPKGWAWGGQIKEFKMMIKMAPMLITSWN